MLKKRAGIINTCIYKIISCKYKSHNAYTCTHICISNHHKSKKKIKREELYFHHDHKELSLFLYYYAYNNNNNIERMLVI